MTDNYYTDVSGTKQQSTYKTKRLTAKEFISRAITLHGSTYDYSHVVYKNTRSKVDILCKSCNSIFSQSVKCHLSGSGCTSCANKSRRKSQDDFIDQASIVHGDTYDYSSTKYTVARAEVTIKCRRHGLFSQKAFLHLRGGGCPECACIALRSNTSEFIVKSMAVHGSSYSYKQVDYVTNNQPVVIRCNKCDRDFKQTPSSHLSGSGCNECARDSLGYSRSVFSNFCKKNNKGEGLLYILYCTNEIEGFYKVGITSRSVRLRYQKKDSMPYSFEIVAEIEESPDYIYDLETQLHRLLKEYHYTPSKHFKGAVTECFTTIKPIERLLKELSTTEQMQLLA